MFKKPENETFQPDPLPATPRAARTDPRRDAATIGPSISIKGDLTGEEDLVIQGRVEGKVDLKQYSVTIGHDGKAKADIFGRLISVEGEVEGNLFGQEQVSVRSSGSVRGNISAPRVAIEDGARFKGTIDMDVKSPEKASSSSATEGRVPVSTVPAGASLSRPGISMKIDPSNPRG